jgi:peptide subunit release factor RF-3
MGFFEEIQRRRTFGIISHPDAGKTTLTETPWWIEAAHENAQRHRQLSCHGRRSP